MIVEYHRPLTLDEALGLLSRKIPRTVPLGGGSHLSQSARQENLAVVDLQALGLDRIEVRGSTLQIGACVRLQSLYAHSQTPSGLKQALANEGGLNFRNQATVAGEIVECDGRSAFATALLALNAQLVWEPEDKKVGIGDYLTLRESWISNGLIRWIEIPLNCDLDIEIVARTPMDRPVVCVALCKWPSGRTRIALGGYGNTPLMAMDGPEAGGAGRSAQNAFLTAGDEWASAEYRSQVAGAVARKMAGGEARG